MAAPALVESAQRLLWKVLRWQAGLPCRAYSDLSCRIARRSAVVGLLACPLSTLRWSVAICAVKRRWLTPVGCAASGMTCRGRNHGPGRVPIGGAMRFRFQSGGEWSSVLSLVVFRPPLGGRPIGCSPWLWLPARGLVGYVWKVVLRSCTVPEDGNPWSRWMWRVHPGTDTGARG